MRLMLLLTGTILSVAGTTNAGDWPMVNGCRERTSFAYEEASLRLPFDTTADHPLGAYDLAFADGVLYVGVVSDSNIVVAYDPDTSTELWRFGIPNSTAAMNCVPAVGESLVYCGGQHGLGLYALDRSTGQQRWFRPFGNLYTRNPIVDDSRLYIIRDSTYCLDAATGATIWSYPFADQGTPAVDDSSLYLPSGQGALALDKFTGELRWTSQSSDRVITALLVSHPFVYVYGNGTINAVRTSDGQVAWSITPEGDIAWLNQGSIAVSDSALFYIVWADSAGVARICCHDRFTGAFRWHHVFDANGMFSPTVANGIVYAATWNPERALWGFDVHSGAVVLRDTTAHYWYQPIVADHRLFAPISGGIREFGNSTGVDDQAVGVSVTALRSYPNPCREIALVSLVLPEPMAIGITVYDIQGRQVYGVESQTRDKGTCTVPLYTGHLAAGPYVYRVEAGDQTAGGRFVVVR